MLAAREDCLSLLRCPISHQRLAFDAQGEASAEDAATRFRSVEGTPVLIDFRSSVLDEQELLAAAGASSVERRRYDGAIRLVKRLLSPPKAATRNNIQWLVDTLEKTKDPLALIVGGGTIGQGMDPLYEHPSIKVIAFDIYRSERTQFLADAHAIPMADNSVDAVVIQAVLEHVVRPDLVVKEIWRVLRPGGLVYAETPFMQQVHEGAYDFTRFTESGHRYLFRRFEAIKSGTTAGPGTQLLWSIDYFARSLFRSRMAGKIAKAAFFWLQSFDPLMPDSYASDGASGVFFLGRKSNVELSAREIIRFYRGAQGGNGKIPKAKGQGVRSSGAPSMPPNNPVRA